MKCLNCEWVRIKEYGFKGRLGESIITCFLCNIIDGDMDNCRDYCEIKIRKICKFCKNHFEEYEYNESNWYGGYQEVIECFCLKGLDNHEICCLKETKPPKECVFFEERKEN